MLDTEIKWRIDIAVIFLPGKYRNLFKINNKEFLSETEDTLRYLPQCSSL
ncbi:hypothetical protein HY745_14720 [Candidatus Desantisbacteria bacterium]|nr:hypothetical protein [Candidatus Desantisbacteria bacterium]